MSRNKKTRSKRSSPESQQSRLPETILGSGTEIEGSLTSSGHVRLEGEFKGNITSLGNIIVGEAGKLVGDLIGETVVVGGLVRGDVTAKRVSILRTGRVLGNLRQEAMFTEEGGFFQGMVTMEHHLDISALFNVEPDPASAVVQQVLSVTEEDFSQDGILTNLDG